MYKVGDIVTCTNIVDYRTSSLRKMQHIFLGHKYKVIEVFMFSLAVRDMVTGSQPGTYSTIFFSKELVLNKHTKVL
jgi:hypothetical protein